MRIGYVYRSNILAGFLIEENDGSMLFRYTDHYFNDNQQPAISLTLPKVQQEYRSQIMFPFFSNMIAEGENKKVQSRQLAIEESDQIGLLLATAGADTIGNITIKQMKT